MHQGLPTPDLSPQHFISSWSFTSPADTLYHPSQTIQYGTPITPTAFAFPQTNGYVTPAYQPNGYTMSTFNTTFWDTPAFQAAPSASSGYPPPTTVTPAPSSTDIDTGAQIFLEFRYSQQLDWHVDPLVARLTDDYLGYVVDERQAAQGFLAMSQLREDIRPDFRTRLNTWLDQALRENQTPWVYPSARLFCLAELYRCLFRENDQYDQLMRLLQDRHQRDIGLYGNEMSRFRDLLDRYLMNYGLEPATRFRSRRT